MMLRDPASLCKTRNNGQCWRSSNRAVCIAAAAAPAPQSRERCFIAFTDLDVPSLLNHISGVEGADAAAAGKQVDSSSSRRADAALPGKRMKPKPQTVAPVDRQGGPVEMALRSFSRRGIPAWMEEKMESSADIDTVVQIETDSQALQLVSSTAFETRSGASPSLLSLQGSRAAVDKLVDAGVIKKAVEDLPLCLIEPVTGRLPVGSSSTGNLLQEEIAAHATWGVAAVKAPQTSLSGEGVKVAVLDTGIDKDYKSHPAFRGINVTARNFTTPDPTATHDVRGHGTHCLGTILGRDVNDMRIGVAPGITDVIIGKVIPDKGTGSVGMLMRGIIWAWDEQRADIISISLAYDLPGKAAELAAAENKTMEEAYSEAQKICAKHGALYQHLFGVLKLASVFDRSPPLIIAACGNGSTDEVKVPVQLPAAADGVVSVGAVKKSPLGYVVADFSNVGATVCAPGVMVFSAAAGSAASGQLLRPESGTSMAAPHVAGVAALWWQLLREEYGADTAAEVQRQLLRNSSTRGFAPGVAARVLTAAVGDGLVQAPPV